MRTFVRETIRTRYEETVSDIAPCGSFAVDGLFPKEEER
jgi:hypothetical protein